MDELWKWLMKTNARAVCAAALLGLAATSAWWAWRLTTPSRLPSTPTPPAEKTEQRPALGLLSYIENELGGDIEYVPGNPFLPPHSGRRHRRPRGGVMTSFNTGALISTPPSAQRPKPIVRPQPIVRPKPIKDPVPPTPTPPVPVPVPVPRREAIKLTLTYGGLIRGTDGRMQAWLTDTETGRTRFVRPGTRIGGVRVHSFNTSTLRCVQRNMATVTLKRGEPTLFEDGIHHD